MWQCRKCSKPVYFAERKQSLGFDWHPNCLRCEECGKKLNPGQHAEHKGVPFCHHPCYGALFGPQLFGHGTRNECHTSFGKLENRDGQIKRSHLEARLKSYNCLYEGKPGELKSREVNGRLVLEGVLRIYWGVKHIIHLKEEDDSRMIATRRQIRIQSRLDVPCYSDSDDEIDNTIWRDDSPNRIEGSIVDEGNSMNHIKRPTTLLPETHGSNYKNFNEIDSLTSVSDDSSSMSPGTEEKEDDKNLAASTTSDDLSDLPSLAQTISHDSLEPLIGPDSDSKSRSPINILSNSSSDFQTDNAEGGPSDVSEEGIPIYNSDTLETHTSASDHFDSETLTSSMTSENCGTLTSRSTAMLEYQTPTNNSFQDCKPLLSSSTEYESTKENLDHSPSDDSEPSTSYSESSDLLTSSLSDQTEPQMPLSSQSVDHISSLKLIKNNANNLKRHSSIEFSVVDHEGNTLSNPLPSSNQSLRYSINGDHASSTSYYSVDSHLNTRDERPNVRSPRNGSVAIRRRPGRRMDKSRLKRRCSINGHFYLRETSSFTPPYGSPCSIWITSKTTAEEVLNMLLEKYKVEMSTFNFALFIVKDSGELRRIKEDESPLIARVLLGPHEDVSKVFIMDAQRTQEVSHEVAQFLNLSIAECRAILTKYEQEEANQVKAIKKKYEDMRLFIQRRRKEIRGT